MPEAGQDSKEVALLAAMLEGCPLGVVGVGRHDRVKLVNRAAEKLTGFAREELIGKVRLADLFGSPDKAAEAFKMLDGPGFGGPGSLTDLDTAVICKNGNPTPVVLSLREAPEADIPITRVAYFQAVEAGRDGSDSRARLLRNGLALRECEERYQALLGSSPDAVALYDAVGRVTYLNPTFVEVFGWAVEEVRGRRLDFVPEEVTAETNEAVGRMVAGETIRNWRTKRFTKDGRCLDIQLSASMIRDEEGKVLGTLVILRDISEQVRLERERARQERLKGVLEMAVAASHEMSQPLQVIVGNGSYLLKELTEGEDAKAAATDIVRAARNLGDIVYKIQRISRYETVTYRGDSKMVDLANAQTTED